MPLESCKRPPRVNGKLERSPRHSVIGLLSRIKWYVAIFSLVNSNILTFPPSISQVNCLLDIFFSTALQDADALDAYFAKHNRPIGPLHGLPVSLKDAFHVKDTDTTLSYVGWIGTFEGRPHTPSTLALEATLVHDLRSLGAVLFCKTSVPQSLMSGETVNNIVGYTHNPKNRHLAAGGSSGGEGALLSLRGSPLGIGTDIAGSIRCPAAFCGLFGLRPSGGRLPAEGAATSMDGQNSVTPVVGPMGPTASGLALLTKSVLGREPWLRDPGVVDMPWREERYAESLKLASGGQGKLAFGVLRTDGAINPQPPVSRAIDLTVKAIESLGHKVSQP